MRSMLPHGHVVPPYTPQNIGPRIFAITGTGGGVTVTVSTRVTVFVTVSYRVMNTVSTRGGAATSPFDTLSRVWDVVRSLVVSCCAANELANESAAARPSAQVVMERTRITKLSSWCVARRDGVSRYRCHVTGILRAVTQPKTDFAWPRLGDTAGPAMVVRPLTDPVV